METQSVLCELEIKIYVCTIKWISDLKELIMTYLLVWLTDCMNDWLTDSTMEQSSSWETNRFSASHELPRILWSPKVHYRINQSPPPLYPESYQSSPCPHPTSWKSILILSFPLRLGLPSGSSCFSTKIVCTTPVPRTCYMPSASRSSLFDHPKNSWWEVQIIRFCSLLTPLLPCPS